MEFSIGEIGGKGGGERSSIVAKVDHMTRSGKDWTEVRVATTAEAHNFTTNTILLVGEFQCDKGGGEKFSIGGREEVQLIFEVTVWEIVSKRSSHNMWSYLFSYSSWL